MRSCKYQRHRRDPHHSRGRQPTQCPHITEVNRPVVILWSSGPFTHGQMWRITDICSNGIWISVFSQLIVTPIPVRTHRVCVTYPRQSGTLGTSQIQKVCITTDSLWSRGHHGTLDTDQVANGSYDRSTWLGNIVCEVVWKDYINLGLHVLGVGGMGLLTGERDGEREGEHLIVVLHKLCWTCLRLFHKHHKVSPYNL